MSVESYEEQILKAVEIIADKKVSDLSFDKTITGTIETVILDSNNVNTGEYKVKYQDSILTAYVPLNDQLYVVGDLVSVKITLGDFSNRNIITGYARKVNTSLALDIANSKTTVYKSEAEFTISEDESIAFLTGGEYFNGKNINQGDMWIVTNFPYLTGNGWKTYTWTGSAWSTPDNRRTVDGGIITANSLHAKSIIAGSVSAEHLAIGDKGMALTGKFSPNTIDGIASESEEGNGHLYYPGGTLTITNSSNGAEPSFSIPAENFVASPDPNTTYWVWAVLSGETDDLGVFTPAGASLEVTSDFPSDTESIRYKKIGIWTTDVNKYGTLALSLGQTYINGNEIITGTVIADYMRVGGGATYIGIDEFYNESKSLILTASSPIYSFDSSDTLTPSNQSITFTANLHHLDISELAFSIQVYDSKGDLISSATPSLDINGNQAILSASELSRDYFSIKVIATAEGYSDFVTVNKVKNGTDGALGTRTAIIELYKWSESEPTDDFPSGDVVYTWETGQISALFDIPNDWALIPPPAPEGQILWGCRTIYTDQSNSPTSIVNFSTTVAYPIGGAGSSGKDGKGYEFIYYLSNNPEAPTKPSAASDQGWSATPSSVTKDNRYLYASFRTSNEGIWGDYSTPVLWAKYGTDGTGVSYIYTRTTTKTPAPGTPAGNGQTGIPNNWTDEPKGVDATNKYEWISVSHYTDEAWQPYSPPSLYNEFTASSFLITLTNENHTFACDSEGNPISGNYADGATTINVLYGTEYLTFEGGSGDPTEEKRFKISYSAVGVSLTPSVNSINSNIFTPQTMTANSATVTFTIRALINGEIVSGNKVMSYSKQIAGASGTSSYFHIAYSNNANGSFMNQIGGTYVGTYVDDNPQDSSNYLDYTWRLWKGADGKDGTDGIRGDDGADGQSSYLHLKYSDDGGEHFTAATPEKALGETPGAWLGQYVDNILQDSEDPAVYTWKKIEGEVGAQGPQGPQGTPGPTGPTGPTGPGILFRGAYSSTETYYANADRRDVISYNNNYYIMKPYSSGIVGKDPSSYSSYWALMPSFASIATDFLLAQDAQIMKVLNIGTNAMNSSANITLNGDTTSPYFSLGQTSQSYDQPGIFIGKVDNSYKLSLVSSDSTKKLLWDGTNFSITGGTITGATITGGVVRTATTGNRIQLINDDLEIISSGGNKLIISATDAGAFQFYSDVPGGSQMFLNPNAATSSGSLQLQIYAKTEATNIAEKRREIKLTSDTRDNWGHPTLSLGIPGSTQGAILKALVSESSFHCRDMSDTYYVPFTANTLSSVASKEKDTSTKGARIYLFRDGSLGGTPTDAAGFGGVILKVWNANTLEVRNRYDDGWGILKAGDIVAASTVTANGIVLTSDKDLKQNITIFEKPIESDTALAAVKKTSPKFFEYKDEEEDNSYLGFIAQDLPAELVHIGDQEKNMLGYSLNEMVAFLWKAVQELAEQVDILEQKEALI